MNDGPEILNESDMPKSLKAQILPYETYYIKKADKAFEKIMPGLSNNKSLDKKRTSKVNGSKPSKTREEDQAKIVTEGNAFSMLYFEFSNVLRHLHQNLVDETERETSFRDPLPSLIDYFNRKGAIDLGMPPRVKRFFEDGDRVLGDPDSNRDAQQIINESKIDFRSLINELLIFFIESKIQMLATDFSKVNASETVLTLRGQALPISVLVCSRYRLRGVNDYPELAADAIELLKNNTNPTQRLYVIVVVFIEQQTDVHQKIKFNFDNEVYKRFPGASSQVRILPATLNNNNLKRFDEDLIKLFDQIRGKKIDFNYEGPNHQPLSQGWSAPKEIEREPSVLKNLLHSSMGRVWEIDFTKAMNRDLFVEFRFDEARLDSFRFMTLTIVPYPDAITKLELQVVNRKDRYYIQIEGGDYNVQPSSRNPSREFIGRVPRVNEGEGWMTYYIDIEKLFELSFAKNGLKLQRISAIRFSGKVTIGSVSLHP